MEQIFYRVMNSEGNCPYGYKQIEIEFAINIQTSSKVKKDFKCDNKNQCLLGSVEKCPLYINAGRDLNLNDLNSNLNIKK